MLACYGSLKEVESLIGAGAKDLVLTAISKHSS